MKTDPELKSLFNKVRTKLGSPFREAASLLQDTQLCELLEMCVEDYAKLVQNWLIENQWSSIYGKDITTTDMAFALSVRSFDYLKDYVVVFDEMSEIVSKYNFIADNYQKQLEELSFDLR